MTLLRWLWVAMSIAYVGAWFQVVGAQWALVALPGAGAVVALVPTAVLLPIALLALPAQALVQAVERRLLTIVVSAYVVVLAGSLSVLSAVGRATPAVVVVFTLGLGAAGALLLPIWTSLVANGLGRWPFDVARIVGPLVAGLVIMTSGVWNAFALTAFSVVFLGGLALAWRHASAAPLAASAPRSPGQQLRPALLEVGQEPVLRRRLLRTVLFVAPGAAWWALLPLVARDELGLDAGGYGALLAAFGIGALASAPVTGVLRDRAPARQLVAGAGIVFAGAIVVICWLPHRWLALLVCLLAGLAWTAVTTALDVRPSGPVLLWITFAGSLAVAAVLWGELAEVIGVSWTLLVAAVAVLAGTVVGLVAVEPGS